MKTAKTVMLMLVAVGLASLAEAAEYIKPSSIPNCIVDLDASAIETISTNQYGQVSNWLSRTENGVSFTRSDVHYEQGGEFPFTNDFSHIGFLPYYSETGLDGLPSVNFGLTPDNVQTVSVLQADALLPTNRTFFFVCTMPAKQRVYSVFCYGYTTYGTCTLLDHAYDPSLCALLCSTDGVWWRDGSRKFDLSQGIGEMVYDWSMYKYAVTYTADVPHLFVMRRSGANTETDNQATKLRPTLGMSSVHYWCQWRNWQANIAEFIVYERDLTDQEVELLSASLMAKWNIAGGVNFWKGGSSGNWSNAENWTDGVPGEGANVCIDSAVNLTVDAKVKLASFRAYNGGSLAIAEGQTFWVTGGLTIPASGYAFSAAGANLSFPVESNLGDCASFSLTGTNTLDFAKGANFEFPATATVSGMLVLSDQGTVAFSADNQLVSAEVNIGSGVLDLNGTRQSFLGGITGVGSLVNSAEAAGTAIVTTKTVSEMTLIEAQVGTNVVLEVPGPGTVEIGGVRDGLNFSLGGGTLAVISNIAPSLISGCVVDLDAMALDSLVLTNDGTQVERWWSRTPNGLAFEHSSLNFWHEGFPAASNDFRQVSYLPWYGATLFGGTKPGIRFGTNPAGDFQKSAIECNQLMPSNVTLFLIVDMPASQKNYYGEVYGPPAWGDQGLSFFKLGGYTLTPTAWQTTHVPDASGWINGVKKYDSTTGLGPSMAFTPTVPHLVCYRRNSVTPSSGIDKHFKTIKPLMGVGSMHVYNGCKFIQCVIGEFIVYDRRLSDAEMDALQQWLMTKWEIAPDEVLSMDDSLGTNTTVTVTGAATYDMSLVPQSATVMTYVKNADGVAPTLTVRGQMDLSKTELSLTGAAKTKSATLIENPDHGISGAFKNAVTIDLGKLKLRHTDSRVRISGEGLIILFR